MINLTNSYKINFVKKSAKGNTMFSIRDYDKSKPDDQNYLNVLAFNAIELKDGDYIIIDKISSVALSTYKDRQGNQKQSTTIFGIVKQSVAPEKKQAPAPTQEPTPPVQTFNDDDFNTGPLLDISADDLPF